MPRKVYEPGYSRAVAQVIGVVARASSQQVASYSLKGFAASLRESEVRLNKQQEAFQRLAAEDAIPAGVLRQLNQDVGAAAQRSVVAAYDNRRNRRGTAPYRTSARFPQNQRFAGGMLRRALASPDFFEATASVLYWGNISLLDQEAKQWRRLNFGAGSRAGAAPGRFAMQWGDFVGEALGIAPDPRPAFALPPGYWFTAGGGTRLTGGSVVAGAEFYPRGEQPPGRWGRPNRGRMTAGIAPSNFLDAGVRRIAEEYPRAISTMMGRLYRDRPTAERIQQRTDVRIPRPSGVQSFTPRRR